MTHETDADRKARLEAANRFARNTHTDRRLLDAAGHVAFALAELERTEARLEEYKREVERREEYLAGADHREKEARAREARLVEALTISNEGGHSFGWAISELANYPERVLTPDLIAALRNGAKRVADAVRAALADMKPERET